MVKYKAKTEARSEWDRGEMQTKGKWRKFQRIIGTVKSGAAAGNTDEC